MIDISTYSPEQLFDLTTLKVNIRNPRKIKADALERLKKSVLEFSKMLAKRPIVYDSDTMMPLGGNQRTKALLESGYTWVPKEWVQNADDFTDEEKRRFVLVDNGRFGEDDIEMLKEEYANDDLAEWGLDLDFDLLTKELAAEKKKEAKQLEAVEDEFDVPDGGIETDIVIGDLFEIGPHRLLCGDSTDSDQVAKLMNGEKADMVFTDPPYNVAFNGRIGKFDVIKNDDLSENEFEDLISGFVSILKILNPNNYYVWCNWKFYGLLQGKLDFKACIVWAKNVFGLGRGYRHQHEFCLFNGKLDEGINNESDLWELAKDTNYQHPTQKPITLASRALNNHKADINIIDLFLGSGSTMVAAHQLERKCYGMELDPKYCQVIIDRMKKLDPTLEIKRNGVLIEP